MKEMFCFLQMKAEIQANPSNFFDSAQTKKESVTCSLRRSLRIHLGTVGAKSIYRRTFKVN
jgi:hypothetical protein